MLVSVALPVYNGLPYLRAAIESILSQDIDLELIISDDVSADASLEVANEIADPRVRILTNSINSGIFGNFNRCIAEARGEFIQLFSQDDLMKPGYLTSQVRMLRNHPGAGMVYGSPDWIDEQGTFISQNTGDRTPEIIGADLYLWIASHYMALPASVSSVMVPRRTFEAIGIFNTDFRVAGDVEFYNRVSERFTILRNMEVLHSVRSHRRMTSALSSSGPLYLREELALETWYKNRWKAADYRKVRRFRSASRGRYHLGWIRRAVLKGRLVEAAAALCNMHRIYPLHWVLWWRLVGFFRPGWRPQPTLSPPTP